MTVMSMKMGSRWVGMTRLPQQEFPPIISSLFSLDKPDTHLVRPTGPGQDIDMANNQLLPTNPEVDWATAGVLEAREGWLFHHMPQ